MQDNLQVTMDEFLPLRDVVFNTLRQAILTGELKPGERLMEIHLANKLGVSRTPIREAIRKLELEGLVTMIPRRGAEVAQITEKSMNDVLEVRRAMDALCVELACDRITPEELQDLKKACDTFEAAVKTDDIKQIAQADVALHDFIVQATGNQRLIQLVNNLPLLLVCAIGATAGPQNLGKRFGGVCVQGGKRSGQIVYACVTFAFDAALLALSTIALVGSTYNAFLYFRF